MKRFLSILLAVLMIASVTVVAVSAADVDAADTAAGTATVTLYNLKGESVTETYAVGETFTAITYMNAAEICGTGGIGSIDGQQSYDSDILELADEFSAGDGMVNDMDAMLPILSKGAVIANAAETGNIYYNSSIATYAGMKFNADNCILIKTHYTVKAAGTATITNIMQSMAVSDYHLTRIYDNGEMKQSNFTNIVELSKSTAPVPTGSTVSGNITSYLTEEDVTLTLTGTDNNFTATTTGKTTYSFSNVPAGTYTLTVSKKDHVTRDYADITVSADLTQDVKIHPLGDINGDGKTNAKDLAMANAHVQKVNLQEGYALKCGDVVKGDGKILAADVARINSHIQKVSLLY